MADYEYSKPHDDFQKLMRAYAGFQVATALVVASKFGEVWCAGAVVFLFAISIPSTIAYGSLVNLTPDDEFRNPQSISFICAIAAFIPSIAAISVLFASASVFAATAFPAGCLAWYITIVALRRHNKSMAIPQEVKTLDEIVK